MRRLDGSDAVDWWIWFNNQKSSIEDNNVFYGAGCFQNKFDTILGVGHFV